MGTFNVFGRNVNTDILKLINEGDRKLDNQNYSDAIELFSEAIEYDNTNWYCYFRRGKAYQLSNNFERAIVDYKKGISFDDNFDLNRGLGESYLMKSDFNNGIIYLLKAFNKLTELDDIFKRSNQNTVNPKKTNWDKANIMNNLAVAYYNIGDKQNAIESCKKGIEFDSTYGGNYGILGSLYLEDQLFKEAVNFFEIGASFGDSRSKDILNDLL
jgi:tetratricopeptide (TPR) repeat protein